MKRVWIFQDPGSFRNDNLETSTSSRKNNLIWKISILINDGKLCKLSNDPLRQVRAHYLDGPSQNRHNVLTNIQHLYDINDTTQADTSKTE